MIMVMLVLLDVDQLDDVLAAWTQAGVIGVTALEGLGAHEQRPTRGLVTARRNVGNLDVEVARVNFTLFGIVSDQAAAQRCLEATELVVGDLAASAAGVWAAWPLAFVKAASLPVAGSGAD